MDSSKIKKPFQQLMRLRKEKPATDNPRVESEEAGLIEVSENTLEESQLADQIYNNAGLGPVVNAGLADYDKQIQSENKFINKLMGPRADDIRGYGESVAKRVSLAVYTMLNRQYGGKVGDLRSYIMALEDERDRANSRYDDLMGRVVGILGDEYRDLRTDSKEFMEKLTDVLGEDLKESRLDKTALAERLADIDGLRARIADLEKDKEQLKEKHESQVEMLKNEHKAAVDNLKAEIDSVNAAKDELAKGKEAQQQAADGKIAGLESEKAALSAELDSAREAHKQFKASLEMLVVKVPDEGIGGQLGKEQYEFLLKDSKVPEVVIGGVGKFIDFKKYLGMSVDRGVKEMGKRVTDLINADS